MSSRYGVKLKITLVMLLLTFMAVSTGLCQEINLDKMKKAGDLVCYQSLKDPMVWYYLPDSPRLAMKNGKPQFSFMKYSRTEKTGKAGINQAEGGGIVHFLVTYGASKNRVSAAQRRLQETYPEARIEGPIIYRKGSFALITSFQEDQQTLVKTVAVGKAPLMEGQKAAVSMALTRQGAELLWESFNSDTPDISLVFDMEFAGVREPYEATIEADWSRVSKHKQLKAGMKYSWFGADVDMLFQELRQNGAIKITTKGENAQMDKIIESAHAKLLQVMFDPAPVDDLSRAAAEKDSYSNLNQAMKLLKDSKAGAKTSALPVNYMDLNSDGFRQFIAAVLEQVFPSAHAASKKGNDKAFQTTEDINKEDLEMLREMFREGVQLKESRRFQEALEKFKEVLEIHRDITGKQLQSVSTLVNIGECLENLRRFSEASVYYRKAADKLGHQSSDGQMFLEKSARMKMLAGSGQGSDADTADNMNKQFKNEQTRDGADSTAQQENKGSVSSAEKPGEQGASEAYNRARRLDETARKSKFKPDESQEALDAYEHYLDLYPVQGARRAEVEGRIRSLKRRIAAAGGPTKDSKDKSVSSKGSDSGMPMPPPPELPPLPDEEPKDISKGSGSKTAGKSSAGAAASSKSADNSSAGGQAKSAKSSGSKSPSSAVKKAVEKAPGFSLVASFKMKNIKRSGKMVYHMNHFRSEKQSFTMAENIGSLYSRYKNDTRVFKALTIDDPVFKQREILVSLDGQDSATFTKYLNFVTVKLRKEHQAGSITSDEVVITPETFNKNGNSFSLGYGYKSDSDRDRWLTYQYQVIWSFHGGMEIRSPWTNDDRPMLSLMPPYRYRGLTIEGEGEELKLAKVRHAVVTVKSTINGKEILTQATIRNQGPAPSLHLSIPQDADGSAPDVSIKWYLKGGKQLSSGEKTIEGDIIYWDELPTKENS